MFEKIKSMSFIDELKKIAYSIGDVESSIDPNFHFKKQYRDEVKRMIVDEIKKKFSLRHPVLTGIPTMGIWPSRSKINSTDKIFDKMIKKHPSLDIDIADAAYGFPDE